MEINSLVNKDIQAGTQDIKAFVQYVYAVDSQGLAALEFYDFLSIFCF